MKPVTIYTTNYCGYCVAAKRLLDQQHVAYREIDVTDDDAKRQWLVQQTGHRTVPQIFFGDESIGGYTDLAEIVRVGELQKRLAIAK